MHRGYIKLWRKIQDSFFYKDSQAVHLFIHILLESNHKDKEFIFNNKKQICKRGQVLIGRKQLSADTGISESKVYRILKMLESEHLIEQQKTNKFSILTVLKYENYQSGEQQNEQPVNNKRTTSEQQVNTNNNVNNVKNDKNKSLDFSFIDNSLKEIFNDWIEYKKERKEKYKTQKSLEACYNHLLSLSKKSNCLPKDIINQSMANNWAGLFEIKDSASKKTPFELELEKLRRDKNV